ncbi:alpha/beta-hydrolase [Aaosphaeria arxii CBS 175.79]|uniref:Alpha/beta-hydrolase n=1 Tax=Aaosphaeria arxii CBS 175.79 TaxID=1450172 RepID=A0A6A5XYU4_9PLEO|nr:alpha/beta-hydrolase [Aaosphaeria arxii CBS 175.79]KAF2017987.1 alpha/beta-hydrolase [Aaosphaeria arxii CBS 175.79]
MASPVVRRKKLFVGAISESTYQNTYRTLEQGKTQYDCLLKATGCGESNSTLACLRAVNATALQTTNCGFNPNLDPEIIPQLPFTAFEKGEYMKIPTILGACNEEGTKNVPQSIDTLSEVHSLLLSRAPSLTNSSISVLDTLYFTNQTFPVFPNSGKYWRPLSRAYAEIYSTCVDNIYQDILAADDDAAAPTWNYRYGVLDPTHEAQGFGAYHVVEMFAIWGPNNTDGNPPKSYNTTNAAIIPVIRNYWTSFIRHLDPNVGKLGEAPVWGRRGKGRERLHFVTNGTAMESLPAEQVRRCEILDPLVRVLEYEPAEGTVTELKLS